MELYNSSGMLNYNKVLLSDFSDKDKHEYPDEDIYFLSIFTTLLYITFIAHVMKNEKKNY